MTANIVKTLFQRLHKGQFMEKVPKKILLYQMQLKQFYQLQDNYQNSKIGLKRRITVKNLNI